MSEAESVRIHAKAVEMIAVGKLKAYAKNARTHDEAQVAALVKVMRNSGFTNPLLVDKRNLIVAGHGRLAAAELLGMTEVPVIRLEGLTADQIKALRISDNQLALRAGWDADLLRAEVLSLGDAGFDLYLLGFEPFSLDAILNPNVKGATDPDEAPDPPANPISKRGDVWLLGHHRITCGDATKAEDVARAMNGAKPHLMVTDPPYGVSYDAAWRNDAAAKGLIGQKRSTRATGKVQNDDRADWSEAWALFGGDVAYVWHGGVHAGEVEASLRAAGLTPRSQIIWVKNNFAISRGDYHWQHEPCWYAVRGKAHWAGDRKQTTVWEIPKPQKSETGHSTQKPVACMSRPLENNSRPGDTVYEPFAGSGTTIIAAEMLGRTCIAIDIDPAYVDVSVLRWEAFTGRSAMLEASGQSFSEVARDRRPEE